MDPFPTSDAMNDGLERPPYSRLSATVGLPKPPEKNSVRLDVGGTAIQETYGTSDPDYVLEVDSQQVTCWVTIPMWQTTRDVDLIVRGDALPEPLETAILTVILPDGCCGGGGPDPYSIDPAHASATVTIEDNDWTVSVGAPDGAADENYDDTATPPVPLNPGQFQIQRTGSGANDHPLDVKFEIPHGHLTEPPYEWRAVADVHPQDQWDYSLEAIDDPPGSGAAVSLAYNAERNLYEGTATIPTGSDVVDIELVPNDDEYIESFEMPETVTLKAVPDDSCGCGGEPGICYVVDPENDRASVTIEDNDAPELYAVSYDSANFIRTDPVYVGAQFADWDVNTLIDEDHWFNPFAGPAAGHGAGHPSCRHSTLREYPATYVRDTPYVAKGEWLGVAEPGADTGYHMYVHAQDTASLGTHSPRATPDYGDKVSTATAESLSAFDNKVAYYGGYGGFELEWRYAVIPQAFSGPGAVSASWEAAGQSNNELYVTWGQPTVDPLYHSVVHVATVAAADIGGTTEGPVRDAIWGEFAGKHVSRRDGTLLKYWGADPTPEYFTTFDLLEHADGRCGAWANFLLDVFSSQGINPGVGMDIVPKPMAGYTAYALRVKSSLAGQGGTPQENFFTEHAVVVLGDTIYDPSYGESYEDDDTHTALSKWEDASIDVLVYLDEYGIQVPIANTPFDEQTMLVPWWQS
jgi:hypothetical protein